MSIAGAFAYRSIYKTIIQQEDLKHIPYKGKVWEPLTQERLEEEAERLYPLTGEVGIDHRNYLRKEGFINGGQWQQERMYSEEEVLELFKQYQEYFSIYRNMQILNAEFNDWFKQNKKKP